MRVERRGDEIAGELVSAFASLCDGESAWPLFLTGPAGTGKTCAALWLLDHAGGRYATAGDLAQLLSDVLLGRAECGGASGAKQTVSGFWNGVGGWPLFVLDELGCREKVSDHHYEAVKKLLDVRHGMPLIVISNHDLGTVARLYDDRIASRLAAGTVVCLKSEDRRLQR